MCWKHNKKIWTITKKNGGWGLNLEGNGICFQITESEIKHSFKQTDPIVAGAFLYAFNNYKKIKQNKKFDNIVNKAEIYILNSLNKKGFLKDDSKSNDVNKLRTNPNSYLFLIYFLFDVSLG